MDIDCSIVMAVLPDLAMIPRVFQSLAMTMVAITIHKGL